MKRIIKDYRTITDGHMMLIKSQYPGGFEDSDLIALKTSDGGYFDALEVRTNEAIFLIKVNHDLLERIEEFEQAEEVGKEVKREIDAERAVED
jgi:hypothetical protein